MLADNHTTFPNDIIVIGQIRDVITNLFRLANSKGNQKTLISSSSRTDHYYLDHGMYRFTFKIIGFKVLNNNFVY